MIFLIKAGKNLINIRLKNQNEVFNLKPEKIPFDVIAEFFSPDTKSGAFLIEQIPDLVQQAVYKYLENPDQEFYAHLIKELKFTKRAISPETFAAEDKINNYIKFDKNLP